MIDNQHIYTVSQLCRETRLTLEGHFLTITIEGELSNVARPASGHIYFTLKDAKSQVQCAMFRAQLRKVGFTPENGMQVVLKARVSLYEARGNFQLIAEHMEAAGEGALRQQFEALKTKLLSEGLFDEAHKKPLPGIATKVGVITSSSGAAIHDILKVLKNRFPLLPILIYPITVQGSTAKQEIAESITRANTRNECDVLILARGGGSLEDLWAFNEEVVARAIHQSTIPIISAIGHEVDYTIADFVADHRAPTPSAAAELISPDQKQWLSHLQYLTKQLSEQLSRQILNKNQQLSHIQHRLQRSHPGTQLQLHAQRLDDFQARLTQSPTVVLQHYFLRLSSIKTQLLSASPLKKIDLYQQRLTSLKHLLPTNTQRRLQQSRLRFEQCNTGLHAFSPLNTLSRGYSITKNEADNSIVNSVKQVSLNDKLHIQFTDGFLSSTVNNIYEKN
jgi:exodeoxyribonuclease VII large subunit